MADQSGLAKYQDSNIGDAWDIAELPNGGFAVANAWTGVLAFYRSVSVYRSVSGVGRR